MRGLRVSGWGISALRSSAENTAAFSGVRRVGTSPGCDKILEPGSDPTRCDSMTALAGWESFYVIVGSSAGALIGLQFVVITLIADMPIARGEAQGAVEEPGLPEFALGAPA